MDNVDQNDLTTSAFLFIFVAIVYYFIRRSAGEYLVSKPIAEVFIIAFLVISSQTVLWISRYKMPHVTVNNFSGSILGRPIVLQDNYGIKWALFNTGEFLEPFHGRGKLATLVVPFNQLKRAGRNYVGMAFVRRTPLRFLPPIVNKYLRFQAIDYNLKNIFFGKFSEDFEHANPDITSYEEKISSLHSQVNFRDKLIEGNNDEIIEQIELGKKLSGQDDKWWKAFRRSPEADKE
jgi:hypothetical protein